HDDYMSQYVSIPSLTPPPPRSTLFPYTTLFRSGVLRGPAPRRPASDERRHAGDAFDDVRGPEAPGRPRGRAAAEPRPRRRATGEDRKSTRLNSSHLGISYAVFCLKKKKRHTKTY